jgi:photosystem II stability/assembly factor-like uncharacterized protein
MFKARCAHKFSNGCRLLEMALVFALLTLSLAAQSVSPQLYGGLKWRLIGPFRGGRSVAVAGVPGDPATFYFGAVDGGIWKTTDAGVVWKPIFDKQPVGSIGALAVAPSDPKVIYAGTGESDIRSDLASGNGVYKSTDAGQTWANVGLRDSRQISRIVVDPRNAETVYVGVLGHAYGPNPERGVYKSIDGGASWTKVLDAGLNVGVSDLAMATDDPDILFAGMWQAQRPPWSTYGPVEGPGSGLYRSLDGGKSWARLTGHGLPEGNWGRVAVAVASDGKRVYALIPGRKPGLYRSDDGGDTWALENADSRLISRSWYFGNITVDPQNPDVLYVPNVALFRSEDGGKTVSVLRGAPGGDDYHQIWVDPKDSTHMVLGTDQGTTVSLNDGETWSSWYNQPTAQFYHVITDNQFPYAVYGAQQDSGSAAVFSRTDHGQITARDWFLSGGDESGYLAPDPDNPNIVYLSGVYGTVYRLNLRTSLSQNITPWPLPAFGTEIVDRKYHAPWTPALLFSPVDHKTLFLGTQFVMKTTDGGLHWEAISPDLTGSTRQPGTKPPETTLTLENAKALGYGVVYTIAPSGLNRDLIWAGTDTGLIHLTRDGGRTWRNVTPPGISDWAKISLIEASHFNPGEAYAAVDHHRLDDQKPYIYRTRDYGASWQLITHGISAPSFLRAVREDPKKQGLLFAGTEFGVYVSFDDGDHWQSLQLNLPVTSIRDLAVHGDDLVVATHGRSFWILDDIMPLRQLSGEAKALGVRLFQPATAIRVDNDRFPGTPLPPEEPTAANPPDGAILDYYLPAAAAQVKLEILDAGGTVVRHFSSDDPREEKHPALPIAERWFPKPPILLSTAGVHRFVWDLAWGSSGGTDADSHEDDYAAPHGPWMQPGAYTVRLTVDGKTTTQPLRIVMDPRSPAAAAELAQQFELGRKIFPDTLRSRQALAEIGSIQKQLSDLQAKLAEPSALKSAVAQALAEMHQITDGDGEASSGRMGLEKANGALISVLGVVEGGDRTVPSQAVSLYEQAVQQMNLRTKEWSDFKKNRLPQLNRQLQGAKLAPIAIAETEREVECLMTR